MAEREPEKQAVPATPTVETPAEPNIVAPDRAGAPPAAATEDVDRSATPPATTEPDRRADPAPPRLAPTSERVEKPKGYHARTDVPQTRPDDAPGAVAVIEAAPPTTTAPDDREMVRLIVNIYVDRSIAPDAAREAAPPGD
jgi:hypothetical protein